MKSIIKTSSQAKKDKAKLKEESTCPECSHGLNFGIRVVKDTGFLKLKQSVSTQYSCSQCGCEWEVGR